MLCKVDEDYLRFIIFPMVHCNYLVLLEYEFVLKSRYSDGVLLLFAF